MLGEICWYSSNTNLLLAEKVFEYVKDLFYESPSRNFLAPAVNFVIFMDQRPSANIALSGGRVYDNFIKFHSVDGCRDMKI